jgi:hypothetical protein
MADLIFAVYKTHTRRGEILKIGIDDESLFYTVNRIIALL